MIEIVHRYRVGVYSMCFEPTDVAGTPNRLTIDDINAMRSAARRAAATLNADVEMRKVIDVYHRLLA